MKNFRRSDSYQMKIWERGSERCCSERCCTDASATDASAMEIVKKTYSLSKQLPSEERFGLVSQITRAACLAGRQAVSIPSNIAEGSSRASEKDKKRFVEIALGSAFELETQLLIIRDLELANPIDAECLRRRLRQPKADKLIERLHEEQRMINSYHYTEIN